MAIVGHAYTALQHATTLSVSLLIEFGRKIWDIHLSEQDVA